MPTEIKDGGPAFPQGIEWDKTRLGEADAGMTLRDYFAAAALSSFAGNETAGALLCHDQVRLAKNCYQLADAMLKAREVK
jgi:hypothetical protein